MSCSQYQLTVNFTNEQLAIIYQAGASVVIGKMFSANDLSVAWQVFKPMRKNCLSWDEVYGIYASTSQLDPDAPIVQHSYTDLGASTRKLYTLKPDGSISHPQDGGSPCVYTLKNSYKEKKIITVGLYQNASLNGDEVKGNPISASPVMLGHTVNMKPSHTINIWIQSHIKSSTVISNVSSPMTPLSFNPEKAEIAVTYNDDTGLFVAC